jgi:hypothetical protein
VKPLVVYTGTQVWEGRPEIRKSRKGRAEHGPGLYFTTRLQTARKYAKGRGPVLRVEISPDLTWLEDAIVPTELLLRWVAAQRGLRHKKEIISDISNNATRTAARISTPSELNSYAEVLVNLMVNYDVLTGSHGPALAEFLVAMGISASHVRMSGNEEWVVLFDPTKVLSWRRVGPDDAEDLPSVR